MSEISWNGRIFVDEPQITPEQYKMFFDRCEFGISFDTANLILRNRAEGYKEEVVPADELFSEARELIKDQISDTRSTSGTIEFEGQSLNYDWDVDITRDGEEITVEDLEDFELNKILTDILDNECTWGMW